MKILFIHLFTNATALFILYFFFDDYDMLYSNLILVFLISALLFPFSVYYNFTNVVDLAWAITGISMIILYVTERIELIHKVLVKNHMAGVVNFLFLLSISISVILYGLRHLLIYIRGFEGISLNNEDPRYSGLRSVIKSKMIFWIVNFFIYHLIPLLMLFFAYLALFQLMDHIIFISLSANNKIFKVSNLGLILSFMPYIGIIMTAVADEQLFWFRKIKRNRNWGYLLKDGSFVKSLKDGNEYNNAKSLKQVIDTGLWKLSRHPNYLGELIFFGSFHLLYSVISRSFSASILGFVSLVSLFVFYSIPYMESKLKKSYGIDYENYTKRTKCLLPYII